MAVLLCLGLASMARLVPPQQIETTLRAGWTAPTAPRIVQDYFTECFFMGMMLVPSHGWAADVFNPQMGLPGRNPCAELTAVLNGKTKLNEAPYTRYWFGGMTFSELGLALTQNVQLLRQLYLTLTLLAMGGILWALRRQKRALLCVALVFAGCFLLGHWHYFQTNLAHAPAFFMPMLLMAAAMLWPCHLTPETRWLAFVTASGVFTGWLDQLVGACPTMLTLWLMLTLLRFRTLNLFVMTGLCFTLSTIAMIGLKQLALFLLLGDHAAFDDFEAQLAMRMAPAGFTQNLSAPGYLKVIFVDMTAKLSAFAVSPELFGLTHLLALLGLAVLPVYLALKQVGRIAWTQWLMWMACIAVFPLWYLVFRQHSVEHFFFMGRFVTLAFTMILAAMIDLTKLAPSPLPVPPAPPGPSR